MASTDDENDAIEQAELAAVYFKSLLRSGVPDKDAVHLATAWILSRKKEPREPWNDG
jgi:hypothetical protein